MYYYILEGSTYDEYHKTIFMSDIKYTQEEFENIIIDTYRKFAQPILESDEYHACGFELAHEDFFWFYFNDERKKAVYGYLKETYELIPVESNTMAKVHIGLGITPNQMTKRMSDALDYSKAHDCTTNCLYEDSKYGKIECKFEED